jgi:protein-disulfide isomerase
LSRKKYAVWLLAIILVLALAYFLRSHFSPRPHVTPPPSVPIPTNAAQIVIQTSPNAQVYLDDVLNGQASPDGRFAIVNANPGEHKLRVSLPGKQDFQQSVTVVAGKEEQIAAALEDLPAPSAAPANPPPASAAPLSEAARDKIVTYVRERFALPDNVKLSLGAMQASPVAPSFNQGTLTSGEGATLRNQTVLVSKDGRFLVLVNGSIIELPRDSPAEMAQRIQAAFKIPPERRLTVGGFKSSPSPDFQQGTLGVDDGKTPRQDVTVLLSQNGKHLIVSELYNLEVDPRQQALRTISLHDEPSQGPASAPVTIVEYADLQCPTCARMHEFLENTLLPRYGNKVRVVFKEYPLPMHDWSFTAAIADQCAYEINPAAYVPLRTAIFHNQQLINITNLRETLLTYGEQAGLDRVQLAGCVDAKSSLPRIQRDMAEAKRVNVDRTPTLFVNGRMMVGLPSDDAYFQLIDTILRGGK